MLSVHAMVRIIGAVQARIPGCKASHSLYQLQLFESARRFYEALCCVCVPAIYLHITRAYVYPGIELMCSADLSSIRVDQVSS